MHQHLVKNFSVFLFLAVVGIGLLSNDVSGAQDDVADVDWNLAKDKRGIQVYTRRAAGSRFREVLTTIELEATVDSVIALLQDMDNCSDWAKTCKEARLVKKNSAFEEIVYGRNNLPFPVLDRDVYSINKWSVDSETGVVEMKSRAHIEQTYPKVVNVVRVQHADVTWRVIPLSMDRVLVENVAHIDPNGYIPAWLTNILLIDVPYKALRRLRALLQTGRYDNVEVALLAKQNGQIE